MGSRGINAEYMGRIDIECLIYRQSIKMKFVVAFLACIVAAQAATFQAPLYEYWCAHSFHVLPRSHYYCYRFHFNHAWCTGAYYRDILVEFPKSFVPKGCEDEKVADNRVDEMIRKLAEARAQIEMELMLPQGNWIKNLCEMNDYYVAIFKDYFHRAYSAYTFNMLDERCKAYSAELDALKDQAIRRFNEQLEKLRLRKIAFVRNIFTCIYAGKAMPADFE